MGSKTRLGSYCSKRANNGVNLVTSRNINTRLARPMIMKMVEEISLYKKFYSRNLGNKGKQEVIDLSAFPNKPVSYAIFY